MLLRFRNYKYPCYIRSFRDFLINHNFNRTLMGCLAMVLTMCIYRINNFNNDYFRYKKYLLNLILLKIVSHDSMCCVNMLNWDLSCRINIMLHRFHGCMIQYLHTVKQAVIQHIDTTYLVMWHYPFMCILKGIDFYMD